MGLLSFLRRSQSGSGGGTPSAAGPVQVQELLDQGALAVDVREPAEWKAGHMPSARHIPLGQLDRRGKELPKGKTIVTVCASGARSARAAAMLRREGYQVVNLKGGMHAWQRAGLATTSGAARRGRTG